MVHIIWNTYPSLGSHYPKGSMTYWKKATKKAREPNPVPSSRTFKTLSPVNTLPSNRRRNRRKWCVYEMLGADLACQISDYEIVTEGGEGDPLISSRHHPSLPPLVPLLTSRPGRYPLKNRSHTRLLPIHFRHKLRLPVPKLLMLRHVPWNVD